MQEGMSGAQTPKFLNDFNTNGIYANNFAQSAGVVAT
jgi:hypothetical protein